MGDLAHFVRLIALSRNVSGWTQLARMRKPVEISFVKNLEFSRTLTNVAAAVKRMELGR
jgi:hypothetical protein